MPRPHRIVVKYALCARDVVSVVKYTKTVSFNNKNFLLWIVDEGLACALLVYYGAS